MPNELELILMVAEPEIDPDIAGTSDVPHRYCR
jgi:hypothetical protein